MGSQYTLGRKRRRTETRSLLVALGLAALLSGVVHLAFLPIVVTLAMMTPDPDDYHVVEFAGLSRDLDPVEREEPEPEYDPAVEIPERQVVDSPIPDPEDLRDPDDEKAEFLSDKSVKVKKQSKAASRLKGAFQVGSATAGPDGLVGEQESPGVVSNPTEAGQDFDAAEEGTVLLGESPMEYEHDPDKPAINLMPTFNAMAAAIQGSGIDNLENIEEGPKTALDTDEWQFAGFFNRIKKAVAQHWHPGSAYAVHDPTGRVYGYKDRETVIKVVLKCNGKLKHTYVQHPSGAEFLDDVAVKAIKKAAPFKNPPQDLCDIEDNIIAFDFGFLVKVGDNSLIKVKKYDY